jgi:tetratricopeptide (TPR) repeat protein
MNTQLRAWCIGTLEATVLLAVAVVPVLVNFYSFRVFELDKAALLLCLMTLAALAGLIALIEARPPGLGAVLRQPLVAATLLLAVATAVSTAASVVPRVSFFGSHARAQGLLALAAVLVLFFAASAVAGEAQRRGRMVAVLILGSVPVATMAIVQALGITVVPGEVESASRAFGTLSNPIFLGAYLMLLGPLTLARALAAVRDHRPVVFTGTVLVAALQVLGLLVSGSRGPLVGWVTAVLVFVLAGAIAARRRAVAWGAVGLGAAAMAFLVAFNLPSSPLAPLRELPVVGRFGQLADAAGGSEAVRLRIWGSVDQLVRELPAKQPLRLLVGYGPEGLKYGLLPYAQTAVAGPGQADRLVDRAHNVLLDALVMTGLPGALALLLVYGAWLLTAAATLGLAGGRRERRSLALLLAAGAAVGAATWLVWPLLAGALTLLGLVGGLLVFLVWALLRRRDDATEVDLLALALLATGAGAVAEAAFGIQTGVTQVVFWALAGLLVAIALGPSPPATAAARATGRQPAVPRDRRSAAGETAITFTWSPGGAALGVVAGAMMSLLAYSFLIHGTARLPATLPVTLLLVAVTWLAAALAASDAGEGLSSALGVSLLTLLLYLALRALTLALSGDAAVLFAVTAMWLLGVALLAGYWLAPRLTRAPFWSGPVGILYPLLALGAVTIAFLWGVQPVQADIYFQSALANFDAAIQADDTERFHAADGLFQRAVARNPREDLYHLLWGERYTRLGTAASGDVESAARAFQMAQQEVGRAEALDPRMPYHTFNRGHVQLLFAQMLPPGQREPVAANAAAALQQSFDQLPFDAQVADELALAKLLQGDATGAIALLEYSRDTLDSTNPTTTSLLGRAYSVAGRTEEAKAALEQAVQSGTANPQDLVMLGDIARQNGELGTAISLYEQAVQGGVRDWVVLYNLGLLYGDNGDIARGLEAMTAAQQLAPPTEAARVQEALDALLRRGQAPPGSVVSP